MGGGGRGGEEGRLSGPGPATRGGGEGGGWEWKEEGGWVGERGLSSIRPSSSEDSSVWREERAEEEEGEAGGKGEEEEDPAPSEV